MRSASLFASGDPHPRWVLLDTNALVLPFTTGFPLIRAIREAVEKGEVRVPRSALGELVRLVQRGVPGAANALALARSLPVAETRLRGDRALVELGIKYGAWVVTADRQLRERLRRAGVVVLIPRGHQRLQRLAPRPPNHPRAKHRSASATVKTRARLRKPSYGSRRSHE